MNAKTTIRCRGNEEEGEQERMKDPTGVGILKGTLWFRHRTTGEGSVWPLHLPRKQQNVCSVALGQNTAVREKSHQCVTTTFCSLPQDRLKAGPPL